MREASRTGVNAAVTARPEVMIRVMLRRAVGQHPRLGCSQVPDAGVQGGSAATRRGDHAGVRLGTVLTGMPASLRCAADESTGRGVDGVVPPAGDQREEQGGRLPGERLGAADAGAAGQRPRGGPGRRLVQQRPGAASAPGRTVPRTRSRQTLPRSSASARRRS